MFLKWPMYNYIFIAVFYVNNIYYYVIENKCIKIKFLGDKYRYKNKMIEIYEKYSENYIPNYIIE